MTQSQWVAPSFTKGAVDRAGALLAQNPPDPLLIGQALDVIDNWRSSHSFPLNTFQVRLRDRSAVVCGRPIVAQRLKRTPSIVQKLRRFPTMKLSQMQDIGGARTVLPTINDIYRLRDLLFPGRTRHRLANEKDYVTEPKPSGYRGVHLVYRYHSDRSEVYNGLLVELQLRSRLQHAWATAVETVGTFVGQALNRGRAEPLSSGPGGRRGRQVGIEADRRACAAGAQLRIRDDAERARSGAPDCPVAGRGVPGEAVLPAPSHAGGGHRTSRATRDGRRSRRGGGGDSQAVPRGLAQLRGDLPRSCRWVGGVRQFGERSDPARGRESRVSTQTRSPSLPGRDPDMAGAEAAMYRAARRARERARQAARSAAKARLTTRLDGLRRFIGSFWSFWRRT